MNKHDEKLDKNQFLVHSRCRSAPNFASVGYVILRKCTCVRVLLFGYVSETYKHTSVSHGLRMYHYLNITILIIDTLHNIFVVEFTIDIRNVRPNLNSYSGTSANGGRSSQQFISTFL
jgi:hypothetical protein